MRVWRVATVGAALASLAMTSGCRLQRKVLPSQPMKIVGVGHVPRSPETPPRPTSPQPQAVSPFSGSITASGDADLTTGALDQLQGRLVAMQMAKQAARRDLARKVEALKMPDGQTVSEILRDNDEKRRRVEDLIRNTPQKGMIQLGGNKCTAFLTLDLSELRSVLEAPEEEAPAPADVTTATVTSKQELRRQAEKEAIENARARALEYVRSLRLDGRETVGDRMARDADFDRAIREKIDSLPAVAVVFGEDGACEATLEMDLADIQRLAGSRRGDFAAPPGSPGIYR